MGGNPRAPNFYMKHYIPYIFLSFFKLTGKSWLIKIISSCFYLYLANAKIL